MSSLKEMLVGYSLQVINAEYGHCVKEKWACQRFLRDVEREDTDDFPYIFDDSKALRFLKWMTNFKHSKGPLAGQNIDPAPIQIFIFGNLYGWVHRDTGYRRFRTSYWQVARKNAKTQSNACVASYEASAFGEPYAEVYIGATKTEQAKILWNETMIQINNSAFKNKFKKAYGKITHEKSGGFIQALSQEAGKTGDGFNPQAGLIDEYHAHKTSEIYEVLKSGQALRSQPLISIITTAGFDLSNPCYTEEYAYVTKLLDPDSDVENDSYFAMVNELDEGDDIKDERNWIKANPIVATSKVGMKFLRDELKIALDVPEKMRNFMTKNMNIWVDMPEAGYMDMNKWDQCELENDDFDEFAQTANAYLGFDLSMTTDLTSIGLVLTNGNEYRLKQVSFMPKDKFYERMAKDKVRFDIYRDRGELILTDGAIVDYTFVKAKILEWAKKYNVKEVCYDKWNAIQMVWDLEQEGLTMIEIEQGIRMLTDPTKKFREAVYEGKMKHSEDKLLRWAMSNARVVADASENIKITKNKSVDRIDPVAASINAFARAMKDNMQINLEELILSDDWGL